MKLRNDDLKIIREMNRRHDRRDENENFKLSLNFRNQINSLLVVQRIH